MRAIVLGGKRRLRLDGLRSRRKGPSGAESAVEIWRKIGQHTRALDRMKREQCHYRGHFRGMNTAPAMCETDDRDESLRDIARLFTCPFCVRPSSPFPAAEDCAAFVRVPARDNGYPRVSWQASRFRTQSRLPKR